MLAEPEEEGGGKKASRCMHEAPRRRGRRARDGAG